RPRTTTSSWCRSRRTRRAPTTTDGPCGPPAVTPCDPVERVPSGRWRGVVCRFRCRAGGSLRSRRADRRRCGPPRTAWAIRSAPGCDFDSRLIPGVCRGGTWLTTSTNLFPLRTDGLSIADTLQQLLRERAAQDTIAIKYDDRRITWRDHVADAARQAAALLAA